MASLNPKILGAAMSITLIGGFSFFKVEIALVNFHYAAAPQQVIAPERDAEMLPAPKDKRRVVPRQESKPSNPADGWGAVDDGWGSVNDGWGAVDDGWGSGKTLLDRPYRPNPRGYDLGGGSDHPPSYDLGGGGYADSVNYGGGSR